MILARALRLTYRQRSSLFALKPCAHLRLRVTRYLPKPPGNSWPRPGRDRHLPSCMTSSFLINQQGMLPPHFYTQLPGYSLGILLELNYTSVRGGEGRGIKKPQIWNCTNQWTSGITSLWSPLTHGSSHCLCHNNSLPQVGTTYGFSHRWYKFSSCSS